MNPPDSAGLKIHEPLQRWRIRAALFLASLALIMVEFGLMRVLAERFWSHFAHMIISVAMLGCGISGVALAVVSPGSLLRQSRMCQYLLLAFSLLIPVTALGAGWVKLNPLYMAWNMYQGIYIAALELFALLPFVTGSMGIALGVMHARDGTGGAYGAGLLGSGIGAVAGMMLLFHFSQMGILRIAAMVAFSAGCMLVRTRDRVSIGATVTTGLVVAGICVMIPTGPAMSEYKALPGYMRMPGTVSLYTAESPLGRIDVVGGPNLHLAPGLELGYRGRIPTHTILLSDGDQPSAVYLCSGNDDRAFLDRLTSAAAYAFLERPKVLIIGAGGGADIHQAIFKSAGSITALEMDNGLIEAMRGPLRMTGGEIYSAPGVTVLNREARNYLATTPETYDLIQMSLVDAFGIAGAGLRAGQESYLFTVEAFETMVRRLTERGVVSVTRWAEMPPRDGLKIIDTLAQAVRRMGSDPAGHIIVIRNWATVTALCFKNTPGEDVLNNIRTFCRERSFDICRMPGLVASETNLFHRLDRPYYYEGAAALLGPDRVNYIERYPFKIGAATDDRPFFYHFLKWSRLSELSAQWGNRVRSFMELGSLLMVFALLQVTLLTGLLLIVPILASHGLRGLSWNNMGYFGYFTAIGAGYMLLEMGFMQKLVLFLGHPVYSAATVIAGFLIFSGFGSMASDSRVGNLENAGVTAAAVVALLAFFYPLLLDPAIQAAMRLPEGTKILAGMLFIAPIAFPMGMLFPLGFRQMMKGGGEMAPWAWGVNGFASVLATVGAPILAMETGFRWLVTIAALCYLFVAGLWFSRACAGDESGWGDGR